MKSVLAAIVILLGTSAVEAAQPETNPLRILPCYMSPPGAACLAIDDEGFASVQQPASTSGHGSIAEKFDLSALVIASGADLASTSHCLGAQRCRELNPILNLAVTSNPAVFGITKMGFTVVMGLLVHWLYDHGHPRIARALAWSAASAWSFAAWKNTRFAPQTGGR